MAPSSRARTVLRRLAGRAPAVLPERTLAALLVVRSRLSPTAPTAGLVEVDRVLVLAPHPDDESILAGGTLALWADAGTAVTVVAVTDGEDSLAGLPTDEIAARRRSELTRACGILGVANVRPLGLPDGQLGDHVAPLATTLTGLLTELRPDIVVLPWFGDDHPDHRAVAGALTSALRQALQAGTHVPTEIWGGEAHTPGPVTRVVDISATVDRKRAALAQHVTAARAFDLEATVGLNRFRSVIAQRGQGYAEAFVAADPATWIAWQASANGPAS